MWQGRVEGIQISPAGSAPMQAVTEAHAVAGRGLEGDRYFRANGTYSKKAGPDRELTLIEAEAVEGFASEYGGQFDPRDSRRNILTRDVPLNHLVGREFRIGDVVLRGIRLCEPCGHLAKLTGQKVVPGLVHRGGLRAQIVVTGTIRVGDIIQPERG